MEKMAWGGPKWGHRGCLPTDPDRAHILGRTDLDFEKFHLFDCDGSQNSKLIAQILDFSISAFPKNLDVDFPKLWISDFPKSGLPGFQKSGECCRCMCSGLEGV